MQKKASLLLLSLAVGGAAMAQQKIDKAVFKEYKPGYYQNSILKDIRNVDSQINKEDNEKLFFMDQSGMELPNKISLYKSQWANPSLSQGNTGSC